MRRARDSTRCSRRWTGGASTWPPRCRHRHAALESATRYAIEREAFGKPIAEHQAIKLKLADMAIRVEAARPLTLDAARLLDRGGPAGTQAAMAKVFASEAAIHCSMEAMRVLGGYGFTVDFPVERYYRDAPLMAIGEGTNEILQLLIANNLLRDRGPRMSDWQTSVSRVDERQGADPRVRPRGVDRRQSFTSSCFLLLRGRLPSPGEERALDAVLNAVLDYALLKPGTVAARYACRPTRAWSPGSPPPCCRSGRTRWRRRTPPASRSPPTNVMSRRAAPVARRDRGAIVDDVRARKERIPGIGHPLFKGVDPRAEAQEVAVAEGLWSDRAELYELVHHAFVDAIGKPDIPINDVGMMALVMLELGFTPDEMTGLAVLSTLPGVIAHVSEELASGTPDPHRAG